VLRRRFAWQASVFSQHSQQDAHSQRRCVIMPVTRQITDDGAWVGYSVDKKGNERYGAYVRPMPAYPAPYLGAGLAGKVFGPIPNTDGRVIWADNSTFFIVTLVRVPACMQMSASRGCAKGASSPTSCKWKMEDRAAGV